MRQMNFVVGYVINHLMETFPIKKKTPILKSREFKTIHRTDFSNGEPKVCLSSID